MVDICFFTKYTSQSATSRYRSFFFVRDMCSKDYNLSIHTFLYSEYLDELYCNRPHQKFKVVFSYLAQCFALLTSSKHLIIENELFPYLPYWVERFFLKHKKYILNYDDNVWDYYTDKFWLKNKYDRLVKHADGVIVANDFLFQKVKVLNSHLVQVPTVIDLRDYERVTQKNDHFTLVWIGTPVTYKYIEMYGNMFQNLAKKIDYELWIVAAQRLHTRAIKGVQMKFFDWSPDKEVGYLKQAHIGIMPLSDDMFSQGKSAFKLIQYLAAGIPLLGSPVGENNHVIKEGYNGYLPQSEEAWIEKIEILYSDVSLREALALHAKEDAHEYSMQKYSSRYRNFVDLTFSEHKE